jgi:hypothetical protein
MLPNTVGILLGALTGAAWWFFGYSVIDTSPQSNIAGGMAARIWNGAWRFGGLVVLGVTSLLLIIGGIVAGSPAFWSFFGAWFLVNYGLIALYYLWRYVLKRA